jgi:hypothetical protein
MVFSSFAKSVFGLVGMAAPADKLRLRFVEGTATAVKRLHKIAASAGQRIAGPALILSKPEKL